MPNPFSEFSDRPRTRRALPMDSILEAHSGVVNALTAGYKKLVADEAGDGLWQPDQDSIERLYGDAWEIVTEIDFESGDVEAFCHVALSGDDPDFFLMGPLGLYISALCNRTPPGEIHIDLKGQELRLPLIGFRLGAGWTLNVDGHLGDLVGISLLGGTLRVNGNVGRYLGAGMESGRIEVTGDAGPHIGEQMAGGEIQVDGRFGGIGRPAGGAVYHRAQAVFGRTST